MHVAAANLIDAPLETELDIFSDFAATDRSQLRLKERDDLFLHHESGLDPMMDLVDQLRHCQIRFRHVIGGALFCTNDRLWDLVHQIAEVLQQIARELRHFRRDLLPWVTENLPRSSPRENKNL